MGKRDLGKDAKEEAKDDDSTSEVEEFSVERVIDKRVVKGKIEYYLKWKGYPESESTWEPVEHLDCPDLIQEFEDKLKKKKDEKPNEKTRDEKPGPSKKKRASTSTGSTSKEETKKEDDGPSKTKAKKVEKVEPSAKVEDVPKGFDRKLEPDKIIGATDSSGALMFLMKWKGKIGKALLIVITGGARAQTQLFSNKLMQVLLQTKYATSSPVFIFS